MNHQARLNKVLVVEGAEALCAEFRTTFVSLGLDVHCVHSLQAAESFVAYNDNWTDYLIIDPDLPDGDGTQFVLGMLRGNRGVAVALMLERLNEYCSLDVAYYGAAFVPKALVARDAPILLRILERQRRRVDGVIDFARKHRLSPLETQVLDAQLGGLPDKAIASLLHTTEHAVNQTIRRIHRKLGASTFREVVCRWRRELTLSSDSPPDEVRSGHSRSRTT